MSFPFMYILNSLRSSLNVCLYIAKKISQIIKDYFYLPFILLNILCVELGSQNESFPPYFRENENFPLTLLY
jgi:hypothetical protein